MRRQPKEQNMSKKSLPAATGLARLRRSVASVSVALGAWVALAGFLLLPGGPDGSAAAVIVMQLYILSQLFWAIGMLGLGHLVGRRAPVLGIVGSTLAALGVLGHAVIGGTILVRMALTPDAEAAAAAAFESAALIPYLALGLLGTAAGLIVLAVGMMRSRTAPLWVPITLIVWVLVEFVLPNFVEWATYLSMVVGVIGFGAAAVAVWRSPLERWQTADEAAPLPGSGDDVRDEESSALAETPGADSQRVSG
jgi:hypothetical protein